MKRMFLFLAVVIFSTNLFAQEAKEKGLVSITKDVVRAQLEFLASDWMEGREMGKKGQFMAADYIASMFKVYGLQPDGDTRESKFSYRDYRKGKLPEEYTSFFQDFNLVEYESGENQKFRIVSENDPAVYEFKYKTDFLVKTTDIAQSINSEVIFAGYGYQNTDEGYDDFSGLDIRGKVVLVLDGFPGHKDTSSAAYKKFKPENRWWKWSLNKKRNAKLVELGAVAVIRADLDYDNVNEFVSNLPFRRDNEYYEGVEELNPYDKEYVIQEEEITEKLSSLYLSKRALKELLKGTGIEPAKFEKDCAEKMKPNSRKLKNRKVEIHTDVNSRIISTRNVIGKIEGEDTENIIVIGGHYDHLGVRRDYIFNGADDNASGTVGVMTLAHAFMEAGIKPKHTIVFAAWSGEEKGLLGSNYYVSQLDKNVILYLNYDMISKNDLDETTGNKASFTYTDLYPVLKEMTESANDTNSFELKIEYEGSPQPSGGSDHAPFAKKDIPIIYYMAGFPDEYHTPLDNTEAVNYDKNYKIGLSQYLGGRK